MTNEDKKDLLDEGTQLAYQYIKVHRLDGNMTLPEADALAAEWAAKVYELLDGLVNDEFTRIEAAAQQSESLEERRVA